MPDLQKARPASPASGASSTTRASRPSAPIARNASGFIPEIQGLRTIALVMVATFHVWFDRVSGGVDVFLLISAYLMTRSLTARAESGIRTDAIAFLIRKFARLLPVGVAVAVLTLAAVVAIRPASVWNGAIGDAFASTFYFENFRLQAAAVDYFAANDAFASPFQHYWSLSIQGQVFVLWAVLHVLGELLARGLRLPVRRVLLWMFGIVFAASLAWSIWFTSVDQVLAYFDTWARLWEFAAGSLLALVQPWLRLPTAARAVMTAVGLAGVLSCAFVLPVESSFPGYAALWPVVSASLVIAAADRDRPAGAGRLLAQPLLTRIGDYTYALYLTHWPVLVLYLAATRLDGAGWRHGALILAISAVLAVVLVHTVEKPVAKWAVRRRTAPPAVDAAPAPKHRRRLAAIGPREPLVIAACAALVAVAALPVRLSLDARLDASREAIRTADYSILGANDPDLDLGTPLQDASMVKEDSVNPGPRCDDDDPFGTDLCYEIPPLTEGEPERTVLTLGNSHTTQFAGTLLEVVERQPSWSMRTQVAPGCNYAFSLNDTATDDCRAVWTRGGEYIAEHQPDLVMVHGTWWAPQAPDIELPAVLDWVASMTERSPDTSFIVLRDNPRLSISPFDCAAELGDDDPVCVAEFWYRDATGTAAAVRDAGGVWVDLTRAICGSTATCPPVRGGVYTYLDDNHLTENYARTLAQHFSDQVHPVVPWWPADAYEGEFVDRTPGGGIQRELNK